MKKWQEERNYRRVRSEGGEVIANTAGLRLQTEGLPLSAVPQDLRQKSIFVSNLQS